MLGGGGSEPCNIRKCHDDWGVSGCQGRKITSSKSRMQSTSSIGTKYN